MLQLKMSHFKPIAFIFKPESQLEQLQLICLKIFPIRNKPITSLLGPIEYGKEVKSLIQRRVQH